MLVCLKLGVACAVAVVMVGVLCFQRVCAEKLKKINCFRIFIFLQRFVYQPSDTPPVRTIRSQAEIFTMSCAVA